MPVHYKPFQAPVQQHKTNLAINQAKVKINLPLTNRTCVKPIFDKEDAMSRTTATKVAGLKVTVPGKDSWWWDMP